MGRRQRTAMMRQQHGNGDDDDVGSRSASHLVDTMKPNNSLLLQHGMWTNAYHASHHRHVGVSHGHADSPSQISLDSESSCLTLCPSRPLITSAPTINPTPIGFVALVSYHRHNTLQLFEAPTTPPEFVFTPLMSPFVGPLRMLDIHSANASRAPSPILLPPLSLGTWGPWITEMGMAASGMRGRR